MNRILKLRNNTIAMAMTQTDVPLNKILQNTRFILHNFRHYKYVDQNFNRQISNIILENLHRHDNPISKSRAINLIVQIHLTNNIKLSSSHSQVILQHLEQIDQLPSLKSLMNTAILYMNSGINSPSLWQIIEFQYLSGQFSNSPDELLKLAYILSSSQIYSPKIWEKLLTDLANPEVSTLNSSQRVVLFKSLAKVYDENEQVRELFRNQKQAFLGELVDSALEHKELLSLRELVGLYLAVERVGLLQEKFLGEVEEIFFKKVDLFAKKDIYSFTRAYRKLPLNQERVEFLKKLYFNLLTKLDKKITTAEAHVFTAISLHFFQNGIISLQEYNSPYAQFIINDKYEVFESLFLARMRSSSILDMMGLSILIQGQLTKHVNQLTPEILLKVHNFFEQRGDASEVFLQITFDILKKYLKTVNPKEAKQQIYAYLIYAKFDPDYKTGKKAVKLANDIVSKADELHDNEVVAELLKFAEGLINEPEHPALKAIKTHYLEKLHKLTEFSLYELLSILNTKDIEGNPRLTEKVEDILVHNFKYMLPTEFCKSFHLIQSVLPEKYTKEAMDKILEEPLELSDIEVLLRRVEKLPSEIREHILKSFRKERPSSIRGQNMDLVGNVILRIMENSKLFKKKVIQDLWEIVSMDQGHFNQKTLDKLIEAYSNATHEKK